MVKLKESSKIKKVLASLQIFLMISFIFAVGISFSSEEVYADEMVCCPQDVNGNYCSYVSSSDCPGNMGAATSCDQTSYCKPGTCAGLDGYCYANYPRAMCEGNNGTYHREGLDTVPECQLGCCLIGTQAAYVTKNRCIEETGEYADLEVDFRENVDSELACLNLAMNTAQGCCVTDTSCTYGAKSECSVGEALNGTGFYNGTYCSDARLRNFCDCAPANRDPKATTCLPDRDEVFWQDSCGNPEGIKDDCDYNAGTLCGDSDGDGVYTCESLDCQGGSNSLTENNNLSINMEDGSYTGRGTPLNAVGPLGGLLTDNLLNGESWCEYDSEVQTQHNLADFPGTVGRAGKDPVGSRYYRHLCINGQELVEPCKDYREEYCYYNTIDVAVESTTSTSGGSKKYTESRCIENEWQVCTNECNTADPNKMDLDDYREALEKDQQCCLGPNRDCYWTGNACVPAVAPGFKFWEGEGADICSRGDSSCSAVFICGGWNRLFKQCDAETGAGSASSWVGAAGGAAAAAILATVLTGGVAAPVTAAILAAALVGVDQMDAGWQIFAGSECLSQDYLQAANNLCRSLGDCGADFNYLDNYGVDNKYTLSYAGFSNTLNISKDLVKYSWSERGKSQLKDKMSHEDRGDVEFTFDYGVPGNLTVPDWHSGDAFYNFSVDTDRPNNMFARFLWGSGEGAAGHWSSPLAMGLYSVGFGIAGALTYGIGSTAAVAWIGGGVGLSTTPVGFLASKGLSYAPKVPSNMGASAGQEMITSTASREFSQAAAQGKLNDAQAQVFRDVLEDEIGKEAQSLTTKQVNDLAAGKAVRGIEEEAAKKLSEKVSDKAAEEFGKQSADWGFTNIMGGISAAMWIYTVYQLMDSLNQKVQVEKVETTCQPWQPAVYRVSGQDDPCEMCNPQYKPGDDEGYVDQHKQPTDVRAFKRCSEYRCKSLGPSCELINKGTTEETCVGLNKLDTNAPKIEPWPDGFTGNITKNDLTQTGTGFKITKEIEIYNLFNIGLKTDEPAQCKMSMSHSRRYGDMDETFFGTNTFKYFHINPMVYPATVNQTEQGVMLTGGGHYKLYLRCTDAVGNANEHDYVIEFDVSNEPDLTPPSIVGSTLTPPVKVGLPSRTTSAQEAYLMYNASYTDITLFVNEPSHCRYSYVPLDYNIMEGDNECETVDGRPDEAPYYKCQFVEGDGGNRIGPAPTGFVSRAGMLQYIYFKCKDKSKNENFNKDPYTVVLRGSEPINITSTKPTGLIKTSTALVNVSLEVQTFGGALLNGNGICKYTTEDNLAENLASMTEFLNTNSSLHTQPWQPSSGEQKFYIGCFDVAGNRDFDTIEFMVERDTTPPFIVRVYRDESFQPPQFTVQINEPGECKDSVEGPFDYETGGNLMNVIDAEGTTFSSTVPNSNVYYVRCRDTFGNSMNPATIQVAEV